MYCSVALSTFILLCSFHYNQSIELFSYQQTETVPIKCNSPFPLCQPFAVMFLLSAFMKLVLKTISYEGNHIMSICSCLISFNIKSSRFIHLTACIRISFTTLNYNLLYECITFCLSVHSLMDRHLGYFYLLGSCV